MKIARLNATGRPSSQLWQGEENSCLKPIPPVRTPALEPIGEPDAANAVDPEDAVYGNPASVLLDRSPSSEAIDVGDTLEKWLQRIRHAHRLDLRL